MYLPCIPHISPYLEEQEARSRAEGLAANTALAEAQRKLEAAEAEAGGLRAELG